MLAPPNSNKIEKWVCFRSGVTVYKIQEYVARKGQENWDIVMTQ